MLFSCGSIISDAAADLRIIHESVSDLAIFNRCPTYHTRCVHPVEKKAHKYPFKHIVNDIDFGHSFCVNDY